MPIMAICNGIILSNNNLRFYAVVITSQNKIRFGWEVLNSNHLYYPDMLLADNHLLRALTNSFFDDLDSVEIAIKII